MDRFVVLSVEDALTKGWIDADEYRWFDGYEGILFDTSTDKPTVISTDRSEPEDASFYRNLAWVPVLLNELNNQIEELKRKQ
jgi:hypothetical protein